MRRTVPEGRIDDFLDGTTGLSGAEAAERRALFGANAIVETPPAGWPELLRETARDPMIWFLVGTALLFVAVGDRVEATILALALLPIAGMDLYLHRRTQASTEGLTGRLASTARVVRDGVVRELPAFELVPGDLVVVGEGGGIPADGILVAGHGIQVDESALTGESMPVRKMPIANHVTAGGQTAVDAAHWGFAGTRVLTSEGRLRVVFTGPETLYGEIVRSAQAGRHERTPLQQAIGSLVTVLVVAALIICAGLAATRFYQGHGLVDAIVSAVALAVAALPEEFPVVFAFFLGAGVYRLARRQALVRRAVVVENIGRVTCICSDKTGTLTEGRLRLAHVCPAEGVAEARLLRAAATASRPGSGDPLDLAILDSASGAGGKVLASFPFTEDRRREVVVLEQPSGDLYCGVKGAPETVLAMTGTTYAERAAWQGAIDRFAATGHKVIGCGERVLPDRAWAGGEPDRDYEFLGLLAFEDPVREGAAEAVASAQSAGIRVLMVTGDHPATARAVARELGLGPGEPRVIEADRLLPVLPRAGADALHDVDVIARAVPTQKLDLVLALQRSGEIVAVTGDGVNDVPALQQADIGIAMGERGTRTAREVAAIVLLDDNIRTIVRAIAEGRQLFANLQRSFAYLLMIHIPLVITAALVPFAGFPLLYLPVHIVWLELIIHPTAMLAFQQHPPPGELRRAAYGPGGRFFSRREWFAIGLVGAFITLAIVVGYERSLGVGRDVEHARSMTLATLILASVAVTAVLNRLSTRAAAAIAACAILSAAVCIQVPGLAALLHLAPLHADDWLLAGTTAAVAAALAALPMRLRGRVTQAPTQPVPHR